MADRDSAFLWETEALRSSSASPQPGFKSHPPAGPHDGEDWLTLREAEGVTGIPISTLRKWARRERVSSYLEETALGPVRRVSLESIHRRAGELGREIRAVAPQEPTPAPTHPAQPPEPPPTKHVDKTPEPTEQGSDEHQTPPPGTMLVPIDAWDKMLMQLGNLHQAGQQLAEARERAAKAETEAKFLRERLAETRGRPASRPAQEFEPMQHIPIDDLESKVEVEEPDTEEIHVRSVTAESPTEPAPVDDGEMTITGYSLEMVKHLYSTWKGRPRR